MTKKYDAVATVGKYKSRSGEEKKRYLTVGTVFADEQGRLSLKLEGIPVGPEWSGWISFYPPKDSPSPEESSRPERKPRPTLPREDSEEIPF